MTFHPCIHDWRAELADAIDRSAGRQPGFIRAVHTVLMRRSAQSTELGQYAARLLSAWVYQQRRNGRMVADYNELAVLTAIIAAGRRAR
jgi:hypothetical protein